VSQHKATEYQTKIKKQLTALFGYRPQWSEYRPSGELRLKFDSPPDLGHIHRPPGSSVTQIEAWCERHGLEIKPAWFSDVPKESRSRYPPYFNVIVPPEKGWKRPKKQGKTAHQTYLYDRVKEFFGADRIWPMKPAFRDGEFRFMIQTGLENRAHDHQFGSFLDWCDENGVRYEDPNEDAKPVHHNIWTLFFIPKEK
jgi:hypothetical protein